MTERNRGAAAERKQQAETAAPHEDGMLASIARRAAEQTRRRTAARRRAKQQEAEILSAKVKIPEPVVMDEREQMRARMEQTERNRRCANGEDLRVVAAKEPEAPPAPTYEEYEDEFDLGRTHAASVARSSLKHAPMGKRGWYLTFPFISGSSALQPEELPEAEQAESPDMQDEADYAPAAMASAGESESDQSSRKVSGGRYSDYARSGGYQRRITTGGPIIIGLLTVLLIGCVIYGKVQTNEVYTKIAELQSEYDDITARNVSMKSEMEGKLTVNNIEEYAQSVLGLIPLNQSQIEYIQIQTEDEVIISEPEENLIVTINDYITSFWEFLRGA